ncbi:hypothetical protein LIER_28741 [Lithospermum erythrorhizon]|uniref:Uncharacterized protein n=1 Tax=Lithospermum erythrorhizon TaxID=34254 RepID=A0AAV3RIM2_LITER
MNVSHEQDDQPRGPRAQRERESEQSPPPQEVENESEEEQDVIEIDNTQPEKPKTITVTSGMYLDANILTGTLIIELLEFQKLSFINKFYGNWYPDMVRQFYTSCRLGKNA